LHHINFSGSDATLAAFLFLFIYFILFYFYEYDSIERKKKDKTFLHLKVYEGRNSKGGYNVKNKFHLRQSLRACLVSSKK
jgi:hypothetical protein